MPSSGNNPNESGNNCLFRLAFLCLQYDKSFKMSLCHLRLVCMCTVITEEVRIDERGRVEGKEESRGDRGPINN